MKIEHIALYVNDLAAAGISLSAILGRPPMRGITMRKPVSAPFSSPLRAGPGWS